MKNELLSTVISGYLVLPCFLGCLIIVACETDSKGFDISTSETDSQSDDTDTEDGSTDPSSSGLEPLAFGARNTFLVTIPLDADSFAEMAFLAAVPAGMKVNAGRPSVIAVPPGLFEQSEREFYDNYLDRYKADFVYSIGQSNGLEKPIPIKSSSLDEATCELARFWQKTDTVVMVRNDNYRLSLSASALAGRLIAPLFYFGKEGVSNKTMACLEKLGVKEAVALGNTAPIVDQLDSAKIQLTSISDAGAVVSWLVSHGHAVDYFAVCNSGDRSHGYAPKSSLAAPLLAAARGGAVVPLNYPDSVFNDGCLIEGTTTTRPGGAADSADGSWRVGKCTVNGEEYNVVLSLQWTDFGHNQGNIDINRNGSFGDDGEFIKRGQVRTFNGKETFIDINTRRLSGALNKHWADVLFTSPTQDQIKADIQKFHDALGHHPKYMVMVGLPDVLPVALYVDTEGKAVTHFGDQHYVDVDEDPLYDIAEGRFVGENASIFTLAASRAITYDDLLDDSWMNRVVAYGHFETDSAVRVRMFGNCGFKVDRIPRWEDIDRAQYSIGVHEDHGWPFGFEPFTAGPTPPVFASTSGCSMGNIIDMIPLEGRLSEYKDFGAVKLARTGAIGFHALAKNATSNFTLNRDVLMNAVLLDGATLGEAHLRDINAAAIRHGAASDENRTASMLYGDPALRIHVPKSGCQDQPPKVQVSGNTVTVSAPETIWCFAQPTDVNKPYDYSGPGLSGFSGYENGKRYIAHFTTKGPVTNIVQTSTPPSGLGWSGKYGCDERPDGMTTCTLNLRFEEIDHKNSCKILQSVPTLSFRFE
ncbi:MAG: hypothetical protein MUC50_14520 [Myxococcota bacterium]|jgi:hypothetical protein|nr:hypothetical protein [Myxococcota bacterium]